MTIARRFRAMNTDIEIRVADAGDLVHAARAAAVFADVEARFSRFREESELCRFNARSQDVFEASTEFIDLIRLAQRLHIATGGIFEPAMLPSLEAAGYDRSFELMEAEAEAAAEPLKARCSVADVELFAAAVRAPEGLRLDFGGIGKGHAVDLAARAMWPARDFVISAGGDMYASGRWDDADGWLAAVADTRDPSREVSRLWLRDAALATSTTAVRRWRRGGRDQHHIIDPRTGAPSCSGVTSVSAIAPTTAEADVCAKTALILGAEEGLRRFAVWGVAGLFVLDDGDIAATADWPAEVYR